MDTKNIKTCIDCANKQFIDVDDKGRKMFYCAVIDGIIRDGIVFSTTDASACIKWEIFKPINNFMQHDE